MDDKVVPGDWVLIHVGFAMSKIDKSEAKEAIKSLGILGAGTMDQSTEQEVDEWVS